MNACALPRGNVGINTTNPSQTLVVQGTANVAPSGTTALFVNSSGQVGIGTAGPSSLLHVQGGDIYASSNINGTSGNTTWRLQPQYNASPPYNDYFRITTGWNPIAGTGEANYAGVGINLNWYQGGSQLEFYTSSTNNAVPTERMRIDRNGNVGIGLTNPSYTLDVSGSTRVTSLRSSVTTSYVITNNATQNYSVAGLAAGVYIVLINTTLGSGNVSGNGLGIYGVAHVFLGSTGTVTQVVQMMNYYCTITGSGSNITFANGLNATYSGNADTHVYCW
jgi:hypothetical protein